MINICILKHEIFEVFTATNIYGRDGKEVSACVTSFKENYTNYTTLHYN